MRDAFPDLRQFLATPNCDISHDIKSIMSFILSLDYNVSRMNDYAIPWTDLMNYRKQIKAAVPKYRTSRFVSESFGEKSEEFAIRKEWNLVVDKLSISNPKQCLIEMNSFSSKPQVTCQFVLGSYLSRNMDEIRSGEQVFQCIHRLVVKQNKRHTFSPQEDNVIRECLAICVSKKMAVETASEKLCLSYKQILEHIKVLEERREKKGLFTLSEDEAILKNLFLDRNFDCSVEGVRKIGRQLKDFDDLSMILARSQRVIWRRWHYFLSPIVLSVHLGHSHVPQWKQDLVQFVIQEKANSFADIHITEVLEKWPFLNPSLVQQYLGMKQNILTKKTGQNLPLWENLEKNQENLRLQLESESNLTRQGDILRLYNEIIKSKM